MLPRSELSMSVRIFLMLALRSTTVGERCWRREKVSNWRVRLSPRLAAVWMASMARGNFGSSRRLKVWALPPMIIRRLLKSCAIPPVSLPIASIFCDIASCSRASTSFSWVSRRSVASRSTLAKPIRLSWSSRIAVSAPVTKNGALFLRTRQPSISCLPCRTANSSARFGTPARRSSGRYRMAKCLPRISSAS